MKTVVPCGRSSVRRALCGLAFLFAGAASPALAQYSSLTTNGTLGTGTFTMNASSGLGRGYSGTAFGNTATLSSGTINLTGTSTLNLGFGFDILLVGGGGAGGSTGTSTTTANGAGSIFAGGGGGGGYLYASNLNTSVVGGTASITVGAGGVAGTGGSAQNGGAGGVTSFVFGSGTYRAGGGGGGSGASAAGAGTAGIGTNGSAAAGGSGGGGGSNGGGGAAATGALPEGLVMLGPETPAAVQQGQALRPTGHNSAAAASSATLPETTPPMALLAVAGQDRDPLPTLVQVKPRLVLPQLNTCCRQEPPGRTALPGIHRRFNGLRWFPQGPAMRTAAKGVAAA